MWFIALAIVAFVFTILYFTTNNRKKKRDEYSVESLEELWRLHYVKPLYIGDIFYVKDKNMNYILCRENFSDPQYDFWERWKPCPDLLPGIRDNHSLDRPVRFVLSDKDSTDVNEFPYIKLLYIDGNTFSSRGLKSGMMAGFNRARFPKVGDLVCDTSSVVWEITGKNASMYELVRPGNGFRYAKDEDIFGVLQYTWNYKC